MISPAATEGPAASPAKPEVHYREVPITFVGFDIDEHEPHMDHSQVDDPELTAASNAEVNHLRTLLPGLPARERVVLYLRYGLNGSEPHSWRELSELLAIGERTARLIHEQAVSRLRLRWGTQRTEPPARSLGLPSRRAAA